MIDSKIEQLIRSSNLEKYEDAIISNCLLSLRMTMENRDDGNIPVAHSKLGGKPDLPIGFSWPKYQDRSLHFIAQVNLAEPDNKLSLLPDKGLLSFFYDSLEQPWGYDPNDRGRWKVLYFDHIEDLERREEPEDIIEKGSYSSCMTVFNLQTTLPPVESLFIDKLRLTNEETDNYYALLEKIEDHYNFGDMSHRILGHPNPIQNEMQLECQLVTHGLYCGDGTAYRDPRRELLEQTADRWKLLLQIDSEEDIGMMWGMTGRLYFWIREEDLRQLNFDNVWVVLQCS